jgi:hypothetical protein
MFAAALQFHGRAVVVGGATTIGKGTLQSHVDLPATRPADPTAHPNWGVLRLTAQLFYRPDGTPLQRRGVVPDIVLPAPLIPGVKREAELPLALPEETITDSAVVADGPAGRAAVSGELLSHLRTRHGQRAATHPELVLWREEQEVVAQRDERVWGRSLAERRTGLAALEDTWSRLRREHRVLARAGAAAGVTWIDVEEVAAVRQAHLDHLRHRPARDGGARTGRLRRGVFPALQPDGSVVEVGLGGFPFEDFVGDAAEVAAAIGVTKGATVEPDDVANLLRSLQALRERNDEGMLAAVRRCLPLEGADDASVRDEFDALLAKLCILDDSLARPEAMWDFPLREALRIVCDWVEVESPAPVTGANAERR